MIKSIQDECEPIQTDGTDSSETNHRIYFMKNEASHINREETLLNKWYGRNCQLVGEKSILILALYSILK